jgi:hypothetical protein
LNVGSGVDIDEMNSETRRMTTREATSLWTSIVFDDQVRILGQIAYGMAELGVYVQLYAPEEQPTFKLFGFNVVNPLYGVPAIRRVPELIRKTLLAATSLGAVLGRDLHPDRKASRPRRASCVAALGDGLIAQIKVKLKIKRGGAFATPFSTPLIMTCGIGWCRVVPLRCRDFLIARDPRR